MKSDNPTESKIIIKSTPTIEIEKSIETLNQNSTLHFNKLDSLIENISHFIENELINKIQDQINISIDKYTLTLNKKVNDILSDAFSVIHN